MKHDAVRYLAHPKVDRDDLARGTDGISELQREVSRSGTEIDGNASFFEVEMLDNVCWPLPLIALGLDGGQGLERSNALVRNERKADDDKDCQENEPGPKGGNNAFKHHGVVLFVSEKRREAPE